MGVDPMVSRPEIGMLLQVGAFSEIVKTGCGTNGALHSTSHKLQHSSCVHYSGSPSIMGWRCREHSSASPSRDSTWAAVTCSRMRVIRLRWVWVGTRAPNKDFTVTEIHI